MKRKIDVFEGINPKELEAPEEPEPWWRRPVVIFIGVFLLILVFSLSFSDVFQGIVQSKSVKQNALFFPNSTIVFENDVLESLQDEYISNEHREIKACLFGSVDDGHYIISNVSFPEVIRANVIHVVSVSCPENTLIDLHGHPINSCLASEQDVSVYGELKQRNPAIRMMIMCSSTRFALV